MRWLVDLAVSMTATAAKPKYIHPSSTRYTTPPSNANANANASITTSIAYADQSDE